MILRVLDTRGSSSILGVTVTNVANFSSKNHAPQFHHLSNIYLHKECTKDIGQRKIAVIENLQPELYVNRFDTSNDKAAHCQVELCVCLSSDFISGSHF